MSSGINRAVSCNISKGSKPYIVKIQALPGPQGEKLHCVSKQYAFTLIIIYIKKFLDSDWLRAVQFQGSTVPKKGDTEPAREFFKDIKVQVRRTSATLIVFEKLTSAYFFQIALETILLPVLIEFSVDRLEIIFIFCCHINVDFYISLQVFGTDVMVTVAKSFEAPIKCKLECSVKPPF